MLAQRGDGNGVGTTFLVENISNAVHQENRYLQEGRNGYWVPDEDVDYAQLFLQVISAETAGGTPISFDINTPSDDPSYLQVRRIFAPNGAATAGVTYGCSRVFEPDEIETPKWAFNLSTGTGYLTTGADQHYYTTELVTAATISASDCFPTEFRVNYYFAEGDDEVIYLELPLPPVIGTRVPEVISSSVGFQFISGGKTGVLTAGGSIRNGYGFDITSSVKRLYLKMTAEYKANPVISAETDGTETFIRFKVQ